MPGDASARPKFDMRDVRIEDVLPLLKRFHAYGGAGNAATYCTGVFEQHGDEDRLVAAYIWQPPAPGAAKAVCPEAPHAVLSLSRMVAVSKDERRLKHISKPLREIMRGVIDRGRWPVLLTYSDEGVNHTGYVYQCSGWERTARNERPFYVDDEGNRVSSYSCGSNRREKLTLGGHTHIQRWEHWACPRGGAAAHLAADGWVREPLPGTWRSGSPKGRWVKIGTAGRSAAIEGDEVGS